MGRLPASRARTVGDDATRRLTAVFREHPRVVREPDGRYRLDLPNAERVVVRQLPAQLRQELDAPDHPDLRRVFPPASNEDDRLVQEYRELIGDQLLAGRLRAVETMESTVDADVLDEEQILAWLSTVNDLRLILGTRLGVTDERQDEDLPDGDPRSQVYALYHYLGFLEDQIIEALSETLPRE